MRHSVRCDRLAHRLHTGSWPMGTSKTIDGNEENLRWSNLIWRGTPVEVAPAPVEAEPEKRVPLFRRRRSTNPDVNSRMVGIQEKRLKDGTIVYSVRVRASTNPDDKSRVTIGTYTTLIEAMVARDNYIRDFLPGWEIRGSQIRQIIVAPLGKPRTEREIAKACLSANQRLNSQMFTDAERDQLRSVVAFGTMNNEQRAFLQRAKERVVRVGPLAS